MRYFLLLSLLLITIYSNAQVSGDITGDDIIDANDYLLLKEKIIQNNTSPLIDFDGDKQQTIRDLLLLHNFLYQNGTSLSGVELKENPATSTITFRTYNDSNKTLAITIKSENLRAFEFEIENIGTIILAHERENIFVMNNKVIGLSLNEDYLYSQLTIHLSLADGIKDIYCFENPILVDGNARRYKSTMLGDCVYPKNYKDPNAIEDELVAEQLPEKNELRKSGKKSKSKSKSKKEKEPKAKKEKSKDNKSKSKQSNDENSLTTENENSSGDEQENSKTIADDNQNTTVKVLSKSSKEIAAMKNTSEGMMIYNTDKKVFVVFEKGNWRTLKVNSSVTIK